MASRRAFEPEIFRAKLHLTAAQGVQLGLLLAHGSLKLVDLRLDPPQVAMHGLFPLFQFLERVLALGRLLLGLLKRLAHILRLRGGEGGGR